MDTKDWVQRFDQAAEVLPWRLRHTVLALPPETREKAEEIRLRLGRPTTVTVDAREELVPSAPPVEENDLRQVLEIASQASAHTVLDKVKNGFLTVRGGHRIGLCGTAVMQNGEVFNLRQISSVAIRVAREVPGAADTILREMTSEYPLQNTLILAPPGSGKTTLLRDLIRCISDGDGIPALRVGVADERGELAALYQGVPQMKIGGQTDVMDGCPKAEGLMMLLRGMNPQVLAADEITAPADVAAMGQAAGCGTVVLATAHGAGETDLFTRPLYRGLMEQDIFRCFIFIERDSGIRHYRVLRREELSCCK